MRSPGDLLFSPETGTKLRVCGVLNRSGTSDDSLFFVPLRTGQRMFGQEHRLTAIAIRLRDPALLREASERLQHIPGAQVVTMTEMLGTFLNLLGVFRTLLLSVALVAVTVSALSIFNTLLAAVVERANELSVMRALGASPWQLLQLVGAEALLLTATGSVLGIALALGMGSGIEAVVRQLIPFAPRSVSSPTLRILLQSMAIGGSAGMLGSLYPAWRASRVRPAEALKGEL
jgi:putative ABC transport system permease protein